MDDLQAFIGLLLATDPALMAVFAAAGKVDREGNGVVQVLDADARQAADYPRILLKGDLGDQRGYGETARPKFFDGRFHVEIVTRQTDAIKEPLTTLYTILNRVNDLLLGTPAQGDDPGLPGVKGQILSTKWKCTDFRQVKPTGRLPVTDPAYKRHGSTFWVRLNRVGY
jgi:hypothetical protein